jgi:hypothetical protein
MKANLVNNQELSLGKFAMRCKVLRKEEENGKIHFTNSQEEIEKHMNPTMKAESQLGDLRIRKENDGLPKKLMAPRIPTLNKKEK